VAETKPTPTVRRSFHSLLALISRNRGASSAETWTSRLRLDRFSAIYLLILFFVLFGALRPDTFLTSLTIRLVFSEGVVTAVLALAFLVPLAANAYDLAIGSNLGLALVLTSWLGLNTGIPSGVGAVMAIGACGVVGVVSGFIIVRLNVNSFIATLGVSQVVLALALYISKNQQLVGAFPQSYLNLGQNQLWGIPDVVYYLAIIAVIVWFVLEHTVAGRYLFATGGNQEAARLAGVPTGRLIWGAFVVSGLLAGIAGVIQSMHVGIGDAATGQGYLFPAIAAVFFGAAQFSQRPNVWGTMVGYFALAFGIQGLTLVGGTNTYWIQPLFYGAALVFAVALASRPKVRAIRARRTSAAAARPAATEI
jgi:ribose transport system permease protein